MYAFVSTPVAPTVSAFHGTRVCPRSNTSTYASRRPSLPHRVQQHPRPSRGAIVMQTTKDKKKSALTFATDIKGNIVWTLRAATPADTDAIHGLVSKVLPRALVEAFLKAGKGTVVAEVSAKGGKEDDTFQPCVMGVALVDIRRYIRDSEKGAEGGVDRRGDLITIAVDEDAPIDDAKEKMLLGAMKVLKDDGVLDISHEVDHPDRIELLLAAGFSNKGKNSDGLTKLYSDLRLANPDPKKKVL